MDSPAASLVVKVTCGTEALERLNQGFTVATTALAAGVEVSLWLTGDATVMVVPGRAEEVELPQAAPLAELRDALLEGARVTVCGQCAARREPHGRRPAAGGGHPRGGGVRRGGHGPRREVPRLLTRRSQVPQPTMASARP